MISLGASDLFLSSHTPPAFRVNGKIQRNADDEPLSAGKTEQMARLMMVDEQWDAFHNNLEMNLAFTLPNIGRFRVNAFRQRGDIALVIRSIASRVPQIESLRLPDILKEMVMLKRGLVLVSGPAGSGKSTTLAAMIDYRNKHDLSHIITVEDPIEYYLTHKQCVVHQREIGNDTKSYHEALINAMRQSPDVLVIGEIRDRDTLEHALNYADTGHLCLATFHANNIPQALERMLHMFEEDKREQIMVGLSLNTKALFGQRLVPTLDGGRTPAYELLVNTPRIQDLIRRGDLAELRETMGKDVNSGMQTFDQSLHTLYRNGIISADTALEHAESVNNMRVQMRLEAAQAGGGRI
jgi:twitching motility protein PilU